MLNKATILKKLDKSERVIAFGDNGIAGETFALVSSDAFWTEPYPQTAHPEEFHKFTNPVGNTPADSAYTINATEFFAGKKINSTGFFTLEETPELLFVDNKLLKLVKWQKMLETDRVCINKKLKCIVFKGENFYLSLLGIRHRPKELLDALNVKLIAEMR